MPKFDRDTIAAICLILAAVLFILNLILFASGAYNVLLGLEEVKKVKGIAVVEPTSFAKVILLYIPFALISLSFAIGVVGVKRKDDMKISLAILLFVIALVPLSMHSSILWAQWNGVDKLEKVLGTYLLIDEGVELAKKFADKVVEKSFFTAYMLTFDRVRELERALAVGRYVDCVLKCGLEDVQCLEDCGRVYSFCKHVLRELYGFASPGDLERCIELYRERCGADKLCIKFYLVDPG